MVLGVVLGVVLVVFLLLLSLKVLLDFGFVLNRPALPDRPPVGHVMLD